MKLNTYHKIKKQPKKAKKQSKPKYDTKLFKKSSDYTNDDKYELTNTLVEFSKLRYGIISSCDCDYIDIISEVININNSWEEIILKLLYMTINNYPDRYMELLSSENVLNQNFSVDDTYGKYAISKNQYKAYKIYDLNIYLEAIFDNKNIYNAIAGLLKINNIPYKTIKFHLVNKDPDIKNGVSALLESSTEVGIKDCEEYLNNNEFIEGIIIKDKFNNLHRMDVALVVFCTYILDNFGNEMIENMLSVGNTGILLPGDSIEIPSSYIGATNYSVYSDLQTEDILEFILTNAEVAGIDADNIKLIFKVKKKNKHEWEVD